MQFNLSRRALTAASVAASFLTLAKSAFASDAPTTTTVNLCPTGDFATLCTEATDLGTVISRIIVILLVGAAVIALFFLIWGGIRWILSGGDKSKVEAARGTIIAAIVGLVIAFLAFFILSIIFQLFGLGQIGSLTFTSFKIFGD